MTSKVFVTANTEAGADELAEFFVTFPDMRELMIREGYICETREEAEVAAGLITDRVSFLPYPMAVWEREVDVCDPFAAQ